MKTIKNIADELGITLDELLSYDQTLRDEPEIAAALKWGQWPIIEAYELVDEEAQVIIESWRDSAAAGTDA